MTENYLIKLKSVLGDGKVVGDTELNFCCPFCLKRRGSVDNNYHLYVNPLVVRNNIKGWYYCHRCFSRGKISDIVNVDNILNYVQLSNYDKVLTNIRNSVLEDSATKTSENIVLPLDYTHCFNGTEAFEYLESRNISKETISKYNIGFGYKDLRTISSEERPKYAGNGRIIFPDYDNCGKLNYWVARTYKNHKCKYKNPPNSNSRDKIYNLSRAMRYDEVIITEGVISCISAGNNAVATYGKNVTQDQIIKLANCKFKKYYVSLDGDALKEAIDVAKSLTARGCEVWVTLLPLDKDPASVTSFRKYVKESTRYTIKNSLKFSLDFGRRLSYPV